MILSYEDFCNLNLNDDQKNFFIKLLYLILVAEKKSKRAIVPINTDIENPENNEYSFEQFAENYVLTTDELLKIREVSNHFRIEFDTVFKELDSTSLVYDRSEIYKIIEEFFVDDQAELNSFVNSIMEGI